MRNRFPPLPAARACGFTLVEAVVVIVVTGVIGGIVALFIRAPVQGYFDSVARTELSDVADLTLRRMARDIRLALPNSMRVSQVGSATALEFLLTKTGGRYLSADEGVPASDLLFETPAWRSLTVVGAMPGGRQSILANDFIVIYNLGEGFAPADAYAGGNRAQVGNVAGNVITLTSNPFGAQVDKLASPTHRFQVVTTPVTYYCNALANGAGSLTRYWNYAINPAQVPRPVGGQSALMANNITSCAFSYASLANVHSGLIGLTLTLQSTNGGTVVLTHQIHVDNTP